MLQENSAYVIQAGETKLKDKMGGKKRGGKEKCREGGMVTERKAVKGRR